MVILTTFFVGNIGHVNVFYDILERKNAFLGYKNKNFKISKKCHFSKVVNPRFWFKNGRFLQFFFFGQYRPGQSFLRYSRTKNAFLGYKNKMFKKSKNWHFFKGVNPWFSSKNDHFSNFFFRQYRPGKCLLWNSRAKKRLSRLQKQEVHGVENWHFSKGVNPWFWSNNGHFSNFVFFVNIDQENVFYDILEQKIRLLSYKKIKIEKAKNWHFSKGVN